MKETVVLNLILLAKTRKIMAKKSGITNYDNYHSIVNNTVDVLKLVQLLIKDSIYKEQLGQKCKVEISNLFAFATAKMATEILLHKY